MVAQEFFMAELRDSSIEKQIGVYLLFKKKEAVSSMTAF